jgi:hypothetical protein
VRCQLVRVHRHDRSDYREQRAHHTTRTPNKKRHNSRRICRPHPGMRHTGCTSPRVALKSQPERDGQVLCGHPRACPVGQDDPHAHDAPPSVARLLSAYPSVTDARLLVKAHNLRKSINREGLGQLDRPDPTRTFPGFGSQNS